MIYAAQILAIMSLIIFQSCDNDSEVHHRYEKIHFEQISAMNNEVSQIYRTKSNRFVDNEFGEIARPIIDSIDVMIGEIQRLPDGMKFHDEIDTVDALIFSSGRIAWIEQSLSSLGVTASKLDMPVPPWLIVKSYKSPDVLIPWRYLLFYHVLKGDAINRLQIVRNDLQYLLLLPPPHALGCPHHACPRSLF
jgi:hypothetical protein